MKRPRLALGLESSRASLNVDACRALGCALAAARAARRLDVREVAARLLLSPAQVHGLERADSDAFYSSQLYLVAVRKYDALVGLSSPLLDELIVRAPDPAGAAASAAVGEPQPHRRFLRPLGAAAMVGTVTVAVGAWVALAGWPFSSHATAPDTTSFSVRDEAALPTLEHLVTEHRPMAPVQLLLKAPDVPSASPARAAAGNAAGYVRVPRATWVFVRYQDNSVVERVISPGDTFLLRETPIYLAVGAASGAEVVIDGERIDTNRFDVNGQLRIGSAFLSASARHR